MSVLVKIPAQLRSRPAIDAACARLGLSPATVGTAIAYDDEISGILVRLPGWSYPIAINETSGEIVFDNYKGAWGDIKELNAFRQTYQIELARIEARKRGASFREIRQPDGSVKLQIGVR